MSFIESLILGNYENNVIPLHFIDDKMNILSELISTPAGNLILLHLIV